VQTDWYEEHFNEEGREEIGFLTIQGNDTVMEDGKEKTVEYLFNERQISKIGYVPAKTITTTGGGRRRNYQKGGGV
jgi:hypothetical protein